MPQRFPPSETGTASIGMNVARKLPRKMNTTISTRMMASLKCEKDFVNGDFDELRRVERNAVLQVPAGSVLLASSRSLRTLSAVSIAFAPGS